MKLKLYEKYDNSTKKGIMIDPNSYYDELKTPYDLKLYETKLKIRGHLEQYKYMECGILKSACFVSSSHGQDSIVVVHLTKVVCDEIGVEMVPVFLNNTLNLYPEEVSYWKKFNKRYNIENSFKQFLPPKDKDGKQITVWTIRNKNQHMENFRNKVNVIFNEKTGNWTKKRSPDCCEQLKRLSVNEYLMGDGSHLKCSFDGRRAVENNNRSRNIIQRGCTYETSFERPRPIRSFLPIAYWTDDDRDRYIKENFLPICPSYEIHDLDRMGCRNCVAYKKWIVNLAKEPTGLGTKDLQMNLDFMYKTEPNRMKEEIEYSLRYIKRKKLKVNEKSIDVVNKFYDLVK